MKITYENKVAIQNDESIARKNKVTDEDMNEIKETVNTNAEDLKNTQTEISNIKTEQTTQNTKIQTLETDNTTNKQDITEIKEKDTERDKYIEELKAENESLKEDLKGLPNATISGESIDLNDSAEMRVLQFEVSGNSRQKTRSGKNLLEIEDGTYTSDGITAVVKDGIITLNGTPTIEPIVFIQIPIKSITLNEIYTLRIFNNKTVSSNNSCGLRLGHDGMSTAYFDTENSKKTWDYINSSHYNPYTFLVLRLPENITFNNFIIYPQLEKGDGTDTWEQGGVSPSPDYPSEVESCGDNVNLFDKNNVTILDAIINSTSKVISSFLGCKTFYIPCQKNKQITISRKEGTRFIVGTTTSIPSLNAVCNQIKINNTGTSITLVTGDNDNYLVVFYYNSGSDILTEQEILDSIKIEQGSTPTPYSQFGQGNINVEMCNKNLAYECLSSKNLNGLGILENENFDIWFCKVEEGKTYVFNKLSNVFGFYVEKPSSTSVTYNNSRLVTTNNTNKFTVPTGSNIKYACVRVERNSTDVQIEQGSTPTDYIEHKSQTYTIPTQQPMLKEDYFDWENKEEVHTWGKVILDGTENCILAKEGFYFTLPLATSKAKVYCTHFKEYTTKAELINNNYGIGFLYADYNFLYIRNIDYIDVTTFKTWLSQQYANGTPVTIYYKLATPTKIPFTEEQKEVAKELANAKTYKGVTHIYSTDEVSPNMEVTYLKDIEMMIGG